MMMPCDYFSHVFFAGKGRTFEKELPFSMAWVKHREEYEDK
jgi:hypothetical protein